MTSGAARDPSRATDPAPARVLDFPTDEKGIVCKGGPLIARSRDPAGNTHSVIEQSAADDS
jgi:hypothetical protein